MYEFIKYTIANGVATITLNRPEVYNALNNEITFELQDALKSAKKNDEVRVLVLTGEGKAFCSGQDLKASSKEPNRSFSDSLHKRYNPIIQAIRNMPKPVICRLNGVAAGAGCSFALACDLIVAAESAKLIEVFVNIGLVLDSGSSYFLPRLVGSAKAFELATMGTRVGAKEAEAMGLINKCVADDELDSAVKTYTDYYAAAPTKAIGLMKAMLNKSQNATLSEMLEYEAYMQDIAGASHDYTEGVQAFLEKRKPNFLGK
ncbi:MULTISPECIES: enoyl-CoA hydratase-related protein [Roseivirga]|jgi:2-(1,2-epoxy-1,2-dihydrophenyl)acetyl-CoA isomerase|uniref:2-(1,2-epoxy-1,2-dihydrophenyl)acetyl-CoA isomerase n=1 Tax=Roseivirga thermotolerans TaxID=1758176 RepID=A0ABQ3I6Q5_9BACT|nr:MULTISPECIES: enoyl-CoA hydratase-related protein [Roseivirga]GHE66890.1 2-(1,2-epoxy-1,2-dihydrophenyl)acetyl-CoA isomerase [Roseivirga thermotolerans]|tara:strand:+ start:2705 stop:3484 length:780 start_codon:yes stop_codon:yes gene_type:complete